MGLDTVEMVLAFEEAFGIKILDADAEHLLTPGDVIDYVCSSHADQRIQSDRTHVAEIVRSIVLGQLGISPERYRENARFIEDFGAD